MRTNKSQFAEYECSPTASSFVFIAGRRAATEVELSSSGRREGVRRLAAPTDMSHSSPVNLGESHLQGVALITRAWGISTELLCIVCLHLSGATSRRIYSNAFFVLAAAAEQRGSFLYGRRTKSIDRARLVELVFPARPVTARLAGSVLDNTSIQLSYKLVSDFHDFS